MSTMMRRAIITAAAGCGGGSLMQRAYASESAQPGDIGVATYNVLSPTLARASYFTKCAPEDCEPAVRLERVIGKIEQLMAEGNGVICLQEVGLSWSGPLQVFFAEKGYNVAFTSYGSTFSDYMGVAVAWDASRYKAVDLELARLSDMYKQWPKGQPQGQLAKFWQWVTRTKPPRDIWREAKDRKNQAIYARFQQKGGEGKTFVVGNYHMPCLFGSHQNIQIVNIHTQMLAKGLERFAGADPYVLLGDFNLQPDGSTYGMLASGALPAGHPDTPVHPKGEAEWTVGMAPLRSAYKECNGAEPVFTNLAAPQGRRFEGTLDYIWMSPAWKVLNVRGLPEQAPEQVYPTADEPSDHLPLAATLRIA